MKTTQIFNKNIIAYVNKYCCQWIRQKRHQNEQWQSGVMSQITTLKKKMVAIMNEKIHQPEDVDTTSNSLHIRQTYEWITWCYSSIYSSIKHDTVYTWTCISDVTLDNYVTFRLQLSFNIILQAVHDKSCNNQIIVPGRMSLYLT